MMLKEHPRWLEFSPAISHRWSEIFSHFWHWWWNPTTAT